MSEIQKLNKTFDENQILLSDEMNAITNKIDEVIEETNSPTNAPKGSYNRALFEAAGAVYNEETGFYELNELTDITEEEMYTIYIDGIGKMSETQNFSGWYSGSQARTNICPKVWMFAGWEVRSLQQSFYDIPNMEIIRISYDDKPIYCNKAGSMLYGNALKLRKILGIFYCWVIGVPSGFYSCINLEEFKIQALTKNLNCFKNTPKINYVSIKYVITEAKNTSAITITVHPTTYSYLMGTTEPTEQVGGTTEEWQALVTLASEKQITFVTV